MTAYLLLPGTSLVLLIGKEVQHLKPKEEVMELLF